MHKVIAVLSLAFLVTFASHAGTINGSIPAGSDAAGILDEFAENWQLPDLRCAREQAEQTFQLIKRECEQHIPGCNPCAKLQFAVIPMDGTTDMLLYFELDVTYDGGGNTFTSLLDIGTDAAMLNPIDISTSATYDFAGQISVTTSNHLSPADCPPRVPPPTSDSIPALGEWGGLILGAGILCVGVFLILRRGLR